MIDKKDFMKLSQKAWYFNGKGYAARGQRIGPRKFNKTLCIYMHREILNAPEGVEVDHINGNKLDNRRFNLRLATRSQNNTNQPKQKKLNCSSRFKGVHWSNPHQAWRVRISFNHKCFEVGLFNSEMAAAMAYDLWVKDIQDDFAVLNFPDAIRG